MEYTINILKCFLILLFPWSAVSQMYIEDIMEEFHVEWEQYKIVYSKTYEDEIESVHRKFVWANRLLSIFRHNIQEDMGMVGYRRGLNSFSDMSREEVLKYMTGFKMPHRPPQESSQKREKRRLLPKYVDWRNNGSVTPVRNQGACGACWAFSALGSLESIHYINTGKLVQLSPQNLIDCSRQNGNNGCDGGFMTEAFRYIKENNGVDTEQFYPYNGYMGACDFGRNGVGATCKGYKEIPEGDEEALKNAVATVGPVATGIDASLDSFQEYKSGIYDDENCGKSLLHAVTVIGYGTEDNRDYWLIKNSWGESWGMKGYMKLLRNDYNLCGIASRASYPIV